MISSTTSPEVHHHSLLPHWCARHWVITPSDLHDVNEFVSQVLSLAAVHHSVAVQIRLEQRPTKDWVHICTLLSEQLRPHDIAVAINDRLDIAASQKISRIHLKSSSVSATDARNYLGNHVWISRAVHSLSELENALAENVNAVVVSPIFETPNKGAPLGIDGLKQYVAAAGDIPVIALGSITPDNEEECFKAGAQAVAMIRGVRHYTPQAS